MGILFFALWLILNGHFAADAKMLQIVLFGLCICSLLYFFLIRFTKFTFTFDMFFLKNVHLFVLYLFVLIGNIFVSNFHVIRMILTPKENPHPAIVHFDVPLRDEMLRTLLANSITLTPGTITVDLTDTEYTVHALKEEYIRGIEDSTLVRILMKMEAKKNGNQ